MARRRSRTGTRTFPRRTTLWVPFNEQITVVTAGTPVRTSTLLGVYFNQTGEELPIGSTVGPVRGLWTAAPSVGTAADVNQIFTAVMQVVKEGGRATAPAPTADILDAMWYGQLAATELQREIAAGTFTTAAVATPLATKAKRKITGNGDELIITAVPGTSTDFILTFFGNVMIMLP